MPVRQIKGVYYWETTVAGQRYYGTFNGRDGEPVPSTKREADDMVSAVRMRIRAGTYGRASGVTNFAEFVDEVYLPYAREHHASSLHDDFRCRMLKEKLGRLDLKDITTMRVEALIKERLDTVTRRTETDAAGRKRFMRRNPTTVRKEFALLSQIFNMAKSERLVTENPCSFVRKALKKRIPVWHRRKRALTPAEEALLLPHLAAGRAHLLVAFRIALWTGMRRGEILSLEKRDLNFSGETVTHLVGGEKFAVPPGWLFIRKTKTGTPRCVPLCRKVRALLADYCRDEAPAARFVFESPVTGGPFRDIRNSYVSAVAAAGIDHLTFHDLRHTWATRAEELGVPEAVKRDILGHSPGSMTASYTHSYAEARERAVELVSDYAEVLTGAKYVKNAEGVSLWLARRTA
jgi:integrase